MGKRESWKDPCCWLFRAAKGLRWLRWLRRTPRRQDGVLRVALRLGALPGEMLLQSIREAYGVELRHEESILTCAVIAVYV